MKKSFVLSFIIPVSIALTVVAAVMFIKDMSVLNNSYADLNKIEFISSSTQRLVSLAQSNQLLPKDVFFIGESTDKALQLDSKEKLSVLVNPHIVLLADEVLDSWHTLEQLIQQDTLDISSITIARDAHFKAMTDLSSSINAYSDEVNSRIAMYQASIMALFFLIALVMLNNLLRTQTELKLSKDLTEMAKIDSATGLYDRSRCQDIFKSDKSANGKKHPAVLVIDLNDLKKVNDSLGHRVGDELISVFARALKGATNVHIIPPFIGRYGGDEFVVYYDDIDDEKDISVFIGELNFLINKSNEKETRFQVEYAVGSAIAGDEPSTNRQLFDLADEDMYKNKFAMKKAKDPNYNEKFTRRDEI